ncbi:Interleukin-21 receptor [Channa argus]|uniref:Interleukin-21 receptor n=1 Tax=Channa argus TaxID=215402 RepID=A0A6G1QPY4_CHAAH|nr:Interleukin-21 receptor [Channa argus]
MSGLTGAMDQSSTLMLNLILLLLLVSTNVICLHRHSVTGSHNLHCVTDYLVTINCSLTITPSENTSESNYSYWLTLAQEEEETLVCDLTNSYGNSSCSVKRPDFPPSTFTDLDTLEISLCHKQNDEPEVCEMLDDQFTPYKNIKPNAPCCLTVTQNSSRHHFTWKSTYEEYSVFTELVENLDYQLHFYKTGEKHNVVSHAINTGSTKYSVDDQNFVPNTEYTARVRASPNQAFYKGQCSDWSTEVQWVTGSAMNGPPRVGLEFDLGKVFIPLCVMVPLILFLCYAPVLKWRQKSFIPTPAPYFHTLYSDCQGDFKSWVITQENSADMLKTEETLQIDTLTKCVAVLEEESQPQSHHQLMEGSAYSNIIDHTCDISLLGVPYIVSTMDQLSAQESSLKNLTLISQPGSPAEGDSGCWLCSNLSLEKDPPWYCNEYCTLSTFQQSTPITTEHHGSSCLQGVIGVDTTRET